MQFGSLTVDCFDPLPHQVLPDSQPYFQPLLNNVNSARLRNLQFPDPRHIASEELAQREEECEERPDDDRHEGEEDVLVAEGDGSALGDPVVPVSAVHPLVPEFNINLTG